MKSLLYLILPVSMLLTNNISFGQSHPRWMMDSLSIHEAHALKVKIGLSDQQERQVARTTLLHLLQSDSIRGLRSDTTRIQKLKASISTYRQQLNLILSSDQYTAYLALQASQRAQFAEKARQEGRKAEFID